MRAALSSRLETSLYRFNTSSDSRMVIFLKTDRDSEAIVFEYPSHHTREAGSRLVKHRR